MAFESFKDFIENTNDDELMDLYVDFLETKDFSKLEKRLKEKGYQPGEYSILPPLAFSILVILDLSPVVVSTLNPLGNSFFFFSVTKDFTSCFLLYLFITLFSF